MTLAIDHRRLDDLVEFARIEMAARDVEPWADILRDLLDRGVVDRDGALWLVKLYNCYDALGSAWNVYRRWRSPLEWATAADAGDAADFPCTQERRGLRGGRVLKHLDSYVSTLAGLDQETWARRGLCSPDDRQANFMSMLDHVRPIWGVGRQTAFEWTEFLAKVADLPMTAPDAQLWESEGPRRSLQRLYGNPTPDLRWLNARAHECRDLLAERGVPLTWEDFETIICDFNVMRDGRYYPGRHLAALREEIDELPAADQPVLLDSFRRVAPPGWADIEPGIDKRLMTIYRDTGRIVTSPNKSDWIDP